MKGLMVHAGGNHITLDQLANTETPANTATWFPIPHIRLIEEAKDSLQRTGYSITDEAHAISKQGMNYFGLLNLRSLFDDRTTTIGLRNSHNQQFPAGIAVGSMVLVCDNLSFSGEINLKRKHTTHVLRDLPLVIQSAIGKLGAYEIAQDQRIANYKTAELPIKDVDHAIMSALRAQVIAPSKLADVMNEFLHPRHDEFAKDGNTVWRLYNSFTEFMKTSLWNLPRRTIALHAVLDSFCKTGVIEGELA